jgi:16S rRNA (adenine1518-N6/adenine1519-N6)-dimethyltransferase
MKQVRPKKNLGQHFLTDLNIAKAIADTVDACPDLPILEVGPGMGVMTQYLVEKPRPFKVVEIDRESVAYLQEHFPEFTRNEEGGTRNEDTLTTEFRRKGNLVPRSSFLLPREIISADFLRMDLREVFDGQQFVLTGNYPYDISSQIFFKMLDNKDLIPCCTGMIQHEVALRMASQPGNKQYGILSVLIQAWYHVEYLFTVEPGVFNPPPKVQSAVIRMTRNEVTDLGCDETLFRRVVKTTFNQRRKMLRVSLRQLFNGAQTASPHFFEDPMMTRRPEQLSIQEFVELTNKVEKELLSDTI